MTSSEPAGGAARARRFPYILTAVVAVCLVILSGLGVWQLQRRAWKEAILARVAALQHAPPRPLGEVLASAARGENVDFTRVEADCPGLASAPFAELYALDDGRMGSRLVSACAAPAAGFGGVLVDRGYVAGEISARPPVTASTAPLHLIGVLRRPDPKTFVTPAHVAGQQWFWRDIAGISHDLGLVRPAPYVLAAETPTNPEWKALKAMPLPADIPNRHLEYAFTWFALALILAGVYAGMLRARLRRPS